MKWIFSSPDASELSRFKNMMGRADIPCEVRVEQPDLPMTLAPLNSELWVMNDDDHPRASDLIKNWCPPVAS